MEINRQFKLEVLNDYEAMSNAAADQIIELLHHKPNAIICIAGGDTPVGLMNNLVEAYRQNKVSFNKCRFIQLDEWVGLDSNDKGSCYDYLNTYLFDPLRIPEENIYSFDAKASNLLGECRKMDEYLNEEKGIDLIVLGIGQNGHLGFNEPGEDPAKNCHIVELDEITKQVGEKYFEDGASVPLSKGITLGLKQILEAEKTVLIASGEAKASIVKEFWYGEVSRRNPASLLKTHGNCSVMIDYAASSGL